MKENIKINKESNTNSKDVKEILNLVEKKFGAGTLMDLNKKGSSSNSMNTGIFTLNEIIGVDGYPRGRIIEMFGPESSGKTTLALITAATVQKNNEIVAFIDAEHALDPSHAKKLGVDLDKLIVSQPDSGEQALDLVNYLCETEKVSLIVVDSVASLIPKAELDGEIGDQSIGLQARMMSKAMRIISSSASKSNTTIIFINQLREKVGVVFGSPEITPGGRSLKFYSTLRIDVRNKEKIKNGSDFIGQKINIKIVKNKVASPYKQTELSFYYDSGIDIEEDYINNLIQKEVITQKGSWFYMGEKVIGKGKKEAYKNLSKT